MDLVKITDGNIRTDSLTVSKVFGKSHKHILRDIQALDCSKEFTESNFGPSEYKDSTGRTLPMYTMTRDGWSFLVMGFTGKKAAKFKEKFISAFNEMEKQLSNKSNLPDFTNPAEAARAWATEFEQRQIAEKTIAEQKPKVLFADSVSASDDTILVGELSKMITVKGRKGYGQNKLFSTLRADGYLIKGSRTDWNMPTQYSMNLGLFIIQERTILNGDEPRITKTPRVTGKGQMYFINKYSS